MRAESTTRAKESIFAAVLLFPLRAVERTRGWRRLALILVYIVIALPIAALLWRRSQLAGLPDVGETYHASLASIRAKAPDDRNAFVLYAQAIDRFRDMTRVEGESFSKANFQWSAADAVFRGWITDNQQATSLLLEGSKRPEAYFERRTAPQSPVDLSESTAIIRLSWIGTAALFEADRLRGTGDSVAAWDLLKAVVRAGRDMERALPTLWCRGTAMTLTQYAREPLSAWAKDPSVSVAMLRRALDDLAAAEALTPPLSSSYRAEYQAAEESLENLHLLIDERARGRAALGTFDLIAYAPNLDTFLRGEPERSRRVLRLLAANDLAWCDRPAGDRPAFAVPRLRIYQSDPMAPPESRALAPDDLARWADSTLINPAPPWRMGELEKWERNDRWSLSELKQAIAVPLFTREMGRPPASPAEALRHFQPAPDDSPDRDEAQPVPSVQPR